MTQRELNGAPPADFDFVSRLPYGHYTFMQVRDGRVRGLGLHLERLARDTRELLGGTLDVDVVRAFVRRALRDAQAASVRIDVFPNHLNWLSHPHVAQSLPVNPDVLVTVGEPRIRPSTPMRVRTARYERFLAHVKHGGIALGAMKHARTAREEGWDDVLYVDGEGCIEEGSTWNIGFLEGDSVVWPDAPALPGVAMLLLQHGLSKKGIRHGAREVTVRDLPRFRAAFSTNSVSIRPIARIDDASFGVDEAMMLTLRACHDDDPGEPI